MAEYSTPSSRATSGQVPVGQGKAYNTSSSASGGQAPVRSTTEGIRGSGDSNARGCVSPLGGVSNPNSSKDNSQRQERSEGPRGPMPNLRGPL